MTEHRAVIQVRHFVEGAQYGYADVTEGGAAKVAGSAADRVVRRAVADAVDLTDHEPNDVIGEVAVAEREGAEDGLRVVDLQFYPLADGGRSEVSLDQTFELLADRTQRDLIAVLVEGEAPMTIEAVADRLRDRHADRSPGGASAAPPATELHHQHLPRLAGLGLIDYDASLGKVTAIRTAETPVRIEGTDPGDAPSFESVFRRILREVIDDL